MTLSRQLLTPERRASPDRRGRPHRQPTHPARVDLELQMPATRPDAEAGETAHCGLEELRGVEIRDATIHGRLPSHGVRPPTGRRGAQGREGRKGRVFLCSHRA